jgi:hypothetical protein
MNPWKFAQLTLVIYLLSFVTWINPGFEYQIDESDFFKLFSEKGIEIDPLIDIAAVSFAVVILSFMLFSVSIFGILKRYNWSKWVWIGYIVSFNLGTILVSPMVEFGSAWDSASDWIMLTLEGAILAFLLVTDSPHRPTK